jgi:RNA polymerase sigma-70 factor (ECF subfamily)
MQKLPVFWLERGICRFGLYDTAIRSLQARPAAFGRHGNTGNPRVFFHGETTAYASEREADRSREPARRRSRRSDLSVFAKELEAAIPALRRYARALTRDAEIADDLVQDTLVRALRSQHLFHGGEVRSWLYTILTNLNRNRLRSLARRPAPAPLGDADAPQMAGPEAGGRDIERALASLVEDQRSALLLVVLEGLSYREVAAVQGVPIGTVMSRLSRARAQIKSYLDGERPALRRVK